MIIIGLTGSIGMGKTTTAKMFADEGIPVQDADKVVHDLYCGKAVAVIEAAFPNTTKDNKVDRVALGKIVVGNSDAMKKLETLIHPLVKKERDVFLKTAQKNDIKIVLLDIPLLFETGMDKLCDTIIVVTATPEEQKNRVLARDGMSEAKFKKILASQMPDVNKRELADYIIDTSKGIKEAKLQVLRIIEKISQTLNQ
ncbi:MAG: dephospho-CoA kinase [Hyphomicrobiales bacterium]|nr:dephospho-CoA kinase [Hyphomicrobiales bacterium]PCH51129.1 MAG: dephospho-CoA kinase [Hyphomicrobiales bacterium]PCH51405.1 MAG: dephospho-CoA kinase [Hyphomicrobiales bacterium]